MDIYRSHAAAIAEAMEKAKKFLLANRKKDGTWVLKNRSYACPAHYDTQSIKSARACNALIILLDRLTPREASLLRLSLQKEITTPLPEDAPIDHYAFKLNLCAYANAKYIEPIRKATIATIMTQGRNGFWQSYSNTYHITNCLILDALMKNGLNPPESFPKWAWSKINTKQEGWGLSRDDEAQPSMTTVIIFSLLLAGVPGNNHRIQKTVDNLKAKQRPDGGWAASNVTDVEHSVIFSTALTLLVLLLTRPNAGQDALKKGIDFLLTQQKRDGSWPYSTNDHTTHYFTMEYVLLLFAYLRFRCGATSPQYSFLQERLEPCAYSIYLYSEFIRDLRSRFIESSVMYLPRTRAFGNTEGAQERRRDILRVLSEWGVKDGAGVIDALKEIRPHRYGRLKKKNHLTLIKNDLSYLHSIGIIQKRGREYFIVATAHGISNNI